MLPDFPFFLCKADILFYNSSFSASFRIEVQCGHLVASMSISLLQNGHTFVVGAGSSSFFAPMEVILFTAFRRQKRINAMITKLITDETKDEANPDTSFSVYVAPPVSTFRIGLIKLSVSDVTIPEKAPPMITPIAMSMTLPRNAKA